MSRSPLIFRVTLLLGWFSLCLFAVADETPSRQQLGERGLRFLDTFCHRCHGVDFRHPGLDLHDRATLLRPKAKDELPFVVLGKPDASRLWQVVVKHDPQQMPPEKQPQPTDADKELLRQRIASGFEFPVSQRPARRCPNSSTACRGRSESSCPGWSIPMAW